MCKLIALVCCYSIVLFGCKKSTDKPDNFNVETFVSITYSDGMKTDLLDPSNANAIKEEDIEVYYLENGQKRHIYDPELDLPKNLKIEKDSVGGKFYLDLAVSTSIDEKGISTTYLEIKNRSTDTITAQLHKSKSSIRVTEAWYNGKEWEEKNGKAMFSIVK